MAKLKTSISLDERLLADLDRQAEADAISRSELIERMCRRALDDEPKVEFFRMHAMPTQLGSALATMSWHDEDGPVELVIRMPASDWERWLRRRRAEAASTSKRGRNA
jgi:hypothetical protein